MTANWSGVTGTAWTPTCSKRQRTALSETAPADRKATAKSTGRQTSGQNITCAYRRLQRSI